MFETNRFTSRYLAISICLFSVAIGLTRFAISGNGASMSMMQILPYGFAVPLTLLCYLFGTICFALAWLPISRLHTPTSAVTHFLVITFTGIVGAPYWHFFQNATRNPRQKQDQLLKRILSHNANTEYGKLHGFADIKSREDFKAKHPLTTYDTYKPYVERTAELGEQNLLTKDQIERFNVSSGTTGKCKLLPSTGAYFKFRMKNMFIPYIYILGRTRRAPYLAPLKCAMFFFVPRWRYSKSGLPVGPASGFTEKQRNKMMLLGRVLPLEAEEYMNEPGQCYLHWLFSLYDKELVRVDSTFGGAMLSALEILQKMWPQLVDDIRNGRITRNHPDIPLHVIERIENGKCFSPDPVRAAELEREFSFGFEGILQRVWPRLNLVLSVVTGQHAICYERLRWYCGPNVTLYTSFYIASEGFFGVNLDPLGGEQLFTLLPHMTFMEFIPEEECTSSNPTTLFIDQLEVGRRYELVVTTVLGLYRYRMGDIIEVVRFYHGKTPTVRFCGRVGSILDLRGEKTSEDMVYSALQKAALKWEGCRELLDYTTTESISLAKASQQASGNVGQEIGLHYVLFAEAEGLSRQLNPEEVSFFDQALGEISYPYKSFRAKGSIGVPKIFIVKKGTFLDMKQASLLKNVTISNQYKTPRYLSDEERITILYNSAYN